MIQRGLIALADISTAVYGFVFVCMVLHGSYSALDDDDDGQSPPTPSPTTEYYYVDDDGKKNGPNMGVGFMFGVIWVVAEAVSFISTCWQRSFNICRIQFSLSTLVRLKATGLFHYFGVYFGSIAYAASLLLYYDELHHIRSTKAAEIRSLLYLSNGAMAIVLVTAVTCRNLSLYLFPGKGKLVSWPVQFAMNLFECGYQTETDVVYMPYQTSTNSTTYIPVTRWGARDCSTACVVRGSNYPWLNSGGGQGCCTGPPCCWPDNLIAKLLLWPIVLVLNIFAVPFYLISFCTGHLFERATCLVAVFSLRIPCFLISAVAPSLAKAVMKNGEGFYTLIDYNMYVGFVTSSVLLVGSVVWCMVNATILGLKILPDTVQSICGMMIEGQNASRLATLFIVCKIIQFVVAIAHPILRLIFNHKIGLLGKLLEDYFEYMMALTHLCRGQVVLIWLEHILEKGDRSKSRDDALKAIDELKVQLAQWQKTVIFKMDTMETEMNEIFEFIFDFDPNYKPKGGLPEHQDDYNPLAGEPSCSTTLPTADEGGGVA
jgi:hypothetical protein